MAGDHVQAVLHWKFATVGDQNLCTCSINWLMLLQLPGLITCVAIVLNFHRCMWCVRCHTRLFTYVVSFELHYNTKIQFFTIVLVFHMRKLRLTEAKISHKIPELKSAMGSELSPVWVCLPGTQPSSLRVNYTTI